MGNIEKQIYTKTLREKAAAKINLFLHIVGKRDDGYHILHSLFVKIPLFDVINIDVFFIKKNTDTNTDVNSNLDVDSVTCITELDPSIALLNSSIDEIDALNNNVFNNNASKNINIVILITKKFFEYIRKYNKINNNIKLNVNIKIHKNIPIAGGLGGGSTDAACVLNALNKLCETNLSKNELIFIGNFMGADVAFFLSGNDMAIIDGVGEVACSIYIKEIDDMLQNIVLINDGLSINTRKVYEYFTKTYSLINNINTNNKNINTYTIMQNAYEARNDLYPAAMFFNPNICTIINNFKNNIHCKIAGLSGSGGTCFGIFENSDNAQEYVKKYQDTKNIYIKHL